MVGAMVSAMEAEAAKAVMVMAKGVAGKTIPRLALEADDEQYPVQFQW